jgi:hypothetical protein
MVEDPTEPKVSVLVGTYRRFTPLLDTLRGFAGTAIPESGAPPPRAARSAKVKIRLKPDD